MLLNRAVLVLNSAYVPDRITSARRAFTLVMKGAAVVEEVSPYMVHTDKIDIPIPAVIRLMKYHRTPRSTRTVSRKGVMLRDQFTCQYCATKFPVGDLTIDHVIPRSRGGPNTWSNMVSSCKPCNSRKGDRTPQEAGMELPRKPVQLSVHAKVRLLQPVDSEVWDRYLFS